MDFQRGGHGERPCADMPTGRADFAAVGAGLAANTNLFLSESYVDLEVNLGHGSDTRPISSVQISFISLLIIGSGIGNWRNYQLPVINHPVSIQSLLFAKSYLTKISTYMYLELQHLCQFFRHLEMAEVNITYNI